MASIELFDPMQLRCEVLRRVAQAASFRDVGVSLATVGAAPMPGRVGQSIPSANSGADVPTMPAVHAGSAEGASAYGVSGQTPPVTWTHCVFGGLRWAARRLFFCTQDTPLPPSLTARQSAVAQDDNSAYAGSGAVVFGRCFHELRCKLNSLWEKLLTVVFLSFPAGSAFRDEGVEELYQHHYMQQWCPRLDWSGLALVPMFVWDVAANPQYRFTLVFRFYLFFVALVVLHKMFFLASRGKPTSWRLSRGALLCSFLLGRGLVCHPPFADTFPEDQILKSTGHVRGATSLIGLSMTNYCAVLALQLHTLDTLMLCLTHGLACTSWAWLALRVPSGDVWQTLLAGHFLMASQIACACIWHQHEQERFERGNFEQELLMERGMLVRSSDCVVRQGTEDDFSIGMRVLYRARCAERSAERSVERRPSIG